MTLLHLTADEVLTTTRSVRKRLDFSRPVEPEVIRECLEIALQAPRGGNIQVGHFVLVTDAEQRRAVAKIYKQAAADAYSSFSSSSAVAKLDQTQQRVISSSQYLAEHMHEAPVLLLPCITGRPPEGNQALFWGSIMPAAWSFMLAARERGLGATWTSMHIAFGYEKAVADVLDIPYKEFSQAALIPVAYTLGTNFTPAKREPLDSILHWNRW